MKTEPFGAVALKRIAIRNLARHKVKTILTILAITVSVSMYIFIDGWLDGMTIDSERNIVNNETGAAKIQSKAYVDKLDEKPMYENFDKWEPIVAALESAGYEAAPRFVFSGTLYSETGSAPVLFNAIDPDKDATILRVSESIEAGRYLRPGAFEIILGSMTADKMKIGIPMRPTAKELENDILPLIPANEQALVKELYEPAMSTRGQAFAPKEEAAAPGNERYLLRRGINQETLNWYWTRLANAGRMNARISTVIDMKAAPDSIRADKYAVDLSPFLTDAEREVFDQVYELDDLTNAWYMVNDDPALQEQILTAMVRMDYSGAIRHVNQLISVVLVGMINSPNPQLNNNIAYIPLDTLQDEAGLMLEGHITELVIRRQNADDSVVPGAFESVPVITAALERIGGTLPATLAVFGWREYVKDFIAASGSDDLVVQIMMIMLFILSLLGIANTMLLAILERTKEIGMMRAQGMTDGQLIFTMMMEAGMVGLIGSAVGIVIGCIINFFMVRYGVDMSAMLEGMGGDIGYRVNGAFKSAWNIPVIVGSGIVATLVSACMAFLPTRNALKMPVTESLRFE
jgi:ABC-type lipoprotein release transport system permease subunit